MLVMLQKKNLKLRVILCGARRGDIELVEEDSRIENEKSERPEALLAWLQKHRNRLTRSEKIKFRSLLLNDPEIWRNPPVGDWYESDHVSVPLKCPMGQAIVKLTDQVDALKEKDSGRSRRPNEKRNSIILKLHHDGMSYGKIVQQLKAKHDIVVSLGVVKGVVHRNSIRENL